MSSTRGGINDLILYKDKKYRFNYRFAPSRKKDHLGISRDA